MTTLRTPFTATRRLWLVALLLLLTQAATLIISGMHWSAQDIMPFVIMAALTLCIPIRLHAACTALPLCWIIAQLVPGFNGAPYVIVVDSAIALLFANCTLRRATCAIAVIATAQAGAGALLVWTAAQPVSTMLAAIMSSMLGMAVAALIGLSIRQSHADAEARKAEAEIAMQRDRIARLQRDNLLASRMHDGLTNDLSYLMMLASHELSDVNGDNDHTSADATADDDVRRAAWQQVATRTDAAFARAHEIIDLLRMSPSAEDDDHDPQRTYTRHDFTACLQQMIELERAQLAALGYRGLAHIRAGEPDVQTAQTMPHAVTDETMRLTHELFANIRRHCAPTEDYSLEIVIGADAITIDQMNTTSGSVARVADARSGKGLQMHRHTLAAIGGELTVTRDDGLWLLHAAIPLAGRRRADH